MERGQNQEHGWEHYAQAFVDARARPAVFLFPDKLVHGYPSHGYIIDYDELHDMGFDVHMFLDSEHVVVQELRHIVAHNVVQLVHRDGENNRRRTGVG